MLSFLSLSTMHSAFSTSVLSPVKTTGEAGGLHWPYKGLIQPRLKTHERFANRK